MDKIQQDVNVIAYKNKQNDGARQGDLKDLDKYKDDQKKIIELLKENIKANEGRISRLERDSERTEQKVMQLESDRDILNNFMKSQHEKNSGANMEVVKLFNKINENEKQATDQLNVKVAELKKIIEFNQKVANMQFKEIEELKINEKMEKNFKALEDLDLYVSEEREKLTKFLEEFESYKEDVSQQLEANAANVSVTPLAQAYMPPPPVLQVNPGLAAAQAKLEALALPATPTTALKAPPVDYRHYVRKAIQEHEPNSKIALNKIVCEMIKEKQSEDAKVLAEHEGTSSDKLPPFEFTHIPSQVEQIIEDHVRQLDDKVVYLEQVRPRFKHFELSSEIQQVFSHMEVQTFQQGQLLKNSLDQDHKLLKMQQEHEELLSFLKKTATRLDQYDSAKTLDIQKIKELEDKSELFRHLLQIFADIKSDILAQTANKGFAKDLDARLATLEKEGLKAKEEFLRSFTERLDQEVKKFAAYQKLMDGLQMQVMKNETLIFDLSTKIETAVDKVHTFQRLDQRLGEMSGEMPEAGSLQRLFVEMNCTPMAVSDKLRKEFDELLVKFESADQRIDFLKIKFDDHTKAIRNVEKEAKGATKEAKDIKAQYEILKVQMKSKIDTKDVDEEVRFLQAQVSALDTKGKATSMRGQNMRQLSKPSGGGAGGGGLSKEDKKKLDQATEGQDKLEESFRVLSQQIHALGVEELKKDVKSLPDKAEKKALDQLQQSVMTQLNAMKMQLKSAEEKEERFQSSINKRLGEMFDSTDDVNSQVRRLDEEVKGIHDTIANVRRIADQAARKANMKPQQAAPVVQIQQVEKEDNGPVIDQSMLEDQNNELTNKFNQQISKLTAKFDDLKLEINQIKGSSKGKVKLVSAQDLQRVEDMLNLHVRNYEQDTGKLNQNILDLNEKFEEKIRRQALVQTKKLSPNASDEELFKEMKKRPKFMAQHMTRELVLNGRLPQLENYGDHLARYGRGFSQMLGIASEQKLQGIASGTTSPRIMEGFSIKDAIISDHEMRNEGPDTAMLGQTVLESMQGSTEELMQNTQVRVTKRSGSIAAAHGENPFAQTTTHKAQKMGKRRGSNFSTIEGKKKQVKIEDGSKDKAFSPIMRRSDSINLILPTIK